MQYNKESSSKMNKKMYILPSAMLVLANDNRRCTVPNKVALEGVKVPLAGLEVNELIFVTPEGSAVVQFSSKFVSFSSMPSNSSCNSSDGLVDWV